MVGHYALFMDGSIAHKLSIVIEGYFHLWFILMIIGLYMCVPLFRPIIKNNDRTKYYLVISFIFAFAIPEIVTLANDFGSEHIITGITSVKGAADNMNMHMVLGYAGYFVLGYYINKINLAISTLCELIPPPLSAAIARRERFFAKSS